MKTFRRPGIVIAWLGSLGLVLAATSAWANHVAPVFVAGNPSCTNLGYSLGFKPQPEPPPSGTYMFPGDASNGVTITSDGTYFDWNSTLGIDAVIVKGGPNANVYAYNPESFNDTGLSSPINPNNGQPYAISHIEFCYDYEVTVSKTANTTFKRTYDWDIEKTVAPETWNLFTGDSGTSEYTVTVTKTGFTDSDWAVSGTIRIQNNTPFSATLTGVSDGISGVGAVSVDCGVSFPYALPSGAALECTYSTSLPDGTSRINTATVTTSGAIGGGVATAGVEFGTPTMEVNATVTVGDTFKGDLGSFDETSSVTYDRTFTCDGDEGTHNNTATINETGDSDSASVTVNCYALTVTKNATTSLKRTWTWTMDKTATLNDEVVDALTLSPGQQIQVTYVITVTPTSLDSDWTVTGTINVANSAPIAATINGVSDSVSPGIAATVDCGVSFPYVLSAGASLVCSYSADLPDATDRTNTASATLQNHNYNGAAAASGTTDFSGSASVSFADATVEEIDECVDVFDPALSAEENGYLQTVCAAEAGAEGIDVSVNAVIGPFVDPDECGMVEIKNTASFATNDTSSTGSDTHKIEVTVACEGGCTLTPGYWKTHSEYGPAPYDDTWAILPSGADTVFFLSGQTYYQVLWTPPRGNAYYILAHAYIAAELNQVNGASIPPDVLVVFAAAADLFGDYTPEEVAAFKGKSGAEIRAQFIGYGSILDEYNNGLTGPGHCSEEETK